MKKTVKFGEVDVELKSSAATPLRFKQFFNFDFLKTIAKIKIEDTEDNIEDALGAGELMSKLAFIMASQAANADFMSLTMDDYYNWLDAFEPNTIPYAEIMEIYANDKKTEVEGKNENAKQNEN